MNQTGGWIEISPVTSLLRACWIGAGLSQCANGPQCLPTFSFQNDATLCDLAALIICAPCCGSRLICSVARRTLRHIPINPCNPNLNTSAAPYFAKSHSTCC